MAVAARQLWHAPPRRRGGPSPRVAPVPAPRRRVGTVPFALLVVALLAVLGVGLVTARTLVAQESFRLQELREDAERLEREFSRLRLRADTMSTLERIERAGHQAGLVYPPDGYEPLRLPPEHTPENAGGGAPGVDGAAEMKAALGAGG